MSDALNQRRDEESTVRGGSGPRRWRRSRPLPRRLPYLATFVEKVSRQRFDAQYTKAVKGTGVEPGASWERIAIGVKRQSKAAAHKVISALVGR
ncbi:hypothetical protein SSOG_09060 [Streptomyces himastatinicus ATCC 53653]|uniref:Uncharacterized protein n=1 Tax=Streptomyces himastatinicus ATCC 53653 TaxID=457427 RepID=D9WL71_9ACTN|nr:hypothetical protein [Streptomyces himastatinicus]EFL29346.1 hypothetical protein SSOG_09060 [Streptomyces himastatinicus ATCC 53653]